MLNLKEVNQLQDKLVNSGLLTDPNSISRRGRRSSSDTTLYYALQTNRGVVHLIEGEAIKDTLVKTWEKSDRREFAEFNIGEIAKEIQGNLDDWQLLVKPDEFKEVRTHGTDWKLVENGKLGNRTCLKLEHEPTPEDEDEDEGWVIPHNEVSRRAVKQDEQIIRLLNKITIDDWLDMSGVEIDPELRDKIVYRVRKTIEEMFNDYDIKGA